MSIFNFNKYLKGLTIRDILLFLAFPVFISVLQYFPHRVTDIFALNIIHPQLWQFVTHSFVHLDFPHFIGNLFCYFAIGFLLLSIANKLNLKNKFFKIFAITLLILPILTAIMLILFHPSTAKFSRGSSDIISAMFAFLVVSVFKLSKENILNIESFAFVLLYAALLFTLIYSAFIVVFISFLLALSIIAFFRKYKDKNYLLAALFIISLFGAFAFPQPPKNVNVFIHYFSFIYGLVVAYLSLQPHFIELFKAIHKVQSN